MLVNDKIIRKFKDIQENKYEIRQKPNNHFYLIITEKDKNHGKIIEGSKKYIFDYLKEKHKNNKFIEI